MFDWLTDMESMQANQTPFSIDYKTLKPQLQLQQVGVSSEGVGVWFVPGAFIPGG